MPSTKPPSQLRLRVFAGPNGSGKSTVIQYVKAIKVKKRPIPPLLVFFQAFVRGCTNNPKPERKP